MWRGHGAPALGGKPFVQVCSTFIALNHTAMAAEAAAVAVATAQLQVLLISLAADHPECQGPW